MRNTQCFSFSVVSPNVSVPLPASIQPRRSLLERRFSSAASTPKKRARTVISSMTSASTKSASDRVIESNIEAGTVAQLSTIILEELKTGHLSYQFLLRGYLALCTDSQWVNVIRVFDAAWSTPSMRVCFSSRMITDYCFASMKLASRSAMRHAFEVFSDIVENKLESKLFTQKGFNFLYVGLCRSGLVDEAIAVHVKCRECGFSLNRYSFNTFLNACSRTRRVSDAFDNFRAMAESNMLPDVVSCNVLISCCVRGDEIALALSVLERMQDWGIAPDVYSYNSVVNGLRKSQMLEEAFDLVARMEIGAGKEPIEGRHPPGACKVENCVHPDLVTYNTLISGIALDEVPDLQRVKAIHEHMKKCGIYGNEVTYNAMMATAARSDCPEEAFAMFDQLLATGSKPNCECYTTLISLCGQVGDIERALSLHQQMIDSGIEPNVVTFNALLNTCRHGDSTQAAEISLDVFEMLRRMPGCDPDVISYSTLIDTLGRDGRFREMRKILDEMIEHEVQPNLVTFTSMIAALSRVDDLDGAMRVMLDMEKSGICPNMYTFSCVFNGACRLNEVDRAFEILQMMRARGVSPSHTTYGTLLEMTIRMGDQDSMNRALLEISKDKRLQDSPAVEELQDLLLGRTSDHGRNGYNFRQTMKKIRECLDSNYQRRVSRKAAPS